MCQLSLVNAVRLTNSVNIFLKCLLKLVLEHFCSQRERHEIIKTSLLKLKKSFHRIRALDDDGGGAQFHIPFNLLVHGSGSTDFPTIPCGSELLPQCPAGFRGSQTKAPGQPGPQLHMLKKNWRNSFSSLYTPLCISLPLPLSCFLSLTHPPLPSPPPTSSHFIRGRERGKKETLIL